MRRSMLILILAGLMSGACDKNEFDTTEPVAAPEGTSTAQAPVAPSEQEQNLPPDHPPIGANPPAAGTALRYSSPAEYGKTGPLRWEAPKAWQAAQPASSMRLAEYVVPGPEGSEPAVMSIFHFGASGGGGVDANVERWVGQFTQPDGSTSMQAAKRETKKVGEMTVHTVDVSGTYNPGMAGAGQPPKSEQRMLGAIVESEAGLFFFKLVGPAKTVSAQADEFSKFVSSMKRG